MHSLDHLIEEVTLLDETSIIIISALAFTIFVLTIWQLKKRRRGAEFMMKTILQPYIKNEIKHIIIPDGIGGLLEIEHLILLEQGLFLIETYPMIGNMYGAETIDLWTQIVDGRSYKFDNPLRRLRISRQAIKSLAPGIPVFCRVIFNSDAIFPKGKPSEVSVLESLAEDMLIVKNEKRIANKAQQAWDAIMIVACKDGQAVTRQGNIHG